MFGLLFDGLVDTIGFAVLDCWKLGFDGLFWLLVGC